MIIIGEKINGTIPAVGEAIKQHNAEEIKHRAQIQAEAGADFIDCAASTVPEIEYDTMLWLIEQIESVTDLPICIDSPNAELLARLLNENRMKTVGMVNSVNEEGTKCETIFPIIAGTDWQVVGLTCDQEGIPSDPEKKIEIAKRIIDKADHYGVKLSNLHIDPCVMALSTVASAMVDFERCIEGIHAIAPEVKMTGAISNISFEMPARKYVNANAMALAMKAGLDSVIADPCNVDLLTTIYATEALLMKDKCGRKYNRSYRAGKIGQKK